MCQYAKPAKHHPDASTALKRWMKTTFPSSVHVLWCITCHSMFPRRGNFLSDSDPWQGPASPTQIQPSMGRVRCPAQGRPVLPLLAVLLYCNSACAGVVTARRLVQPSGEASLQVLSSLLRSLCKSEHRNTQAGELTMKHQTGRLPCQVFKVSQRKLVLKDFSGTHCVLTHCIRHGFISSFKKLSFKSISPKVTCSVSLCKVFEKRS